MNTVADSADPPEHRLTPPPTERAAQAEVVTGAQAAARDESARSAAPAPGEANPPGLAVAADADQPAAEEVATLDTDPPQPKAAALEDAPAPSSVPAASPAGDAAPTELSPAETAARLAELFPALFAAIPNTPPRPIKLRIQVDIQARAPGVFTRRSLSPFLHRHTTTTAYLKALVASAHRFDLDGAPAGEVSDEHRLAAQAELERRWAIVQARRAASRTAAHEAGPSARDADPRRVTDDRRGARPAHVEPRRPDPRPRQAERPGRGPHSPTARGEPRPHAARRPRDGDDPRSPRTPRPATAPAGPEVTASAAAPAAPLPADPARRERALLLRAYETTTLSRANFCALKRIDPNTLDALLEQARAEAGVTGARERPMR